MGRRYFRRSFLKTPILPKFGTKFPGYFDKQPEYKFIRVSGLLILIFSALGIWFSLRYSDPLIYCQRSSGMLSIDFFGAFTGLGVAIILLGRLNLKILSEFSIAAVIPAVFLGILVISVSLLRYLFCVF